jgi:lactoylglutathione lyase
MQIKTKFDHFNINFANLERSVEFYKQALGLVEHHRMESPNGDFTLVYLTDESGLFRLELTWLAAHTENYELGENESHLAMRVDGDYEQARQFHKEMGCVCYENLDMGIYFIEDPDGYWVEIVH